MRLRFAREILEIRKRKKEGMVFAGKIVLNEQTSARIEFSYNAVAQAGLGSCLGAICKPFGEPAVLAWVRRSVSGDDPSDK